MWPVSQLDQPVVHWSASVVVHPLVHIILFEWSNRVVNAKGSEIACGEMRLALNKWVSVPWSNAARNGPPHTTVLSLLFE